ncbi:Zinc carboxypeptidase family protein [Brugia malayi]|uniref:Zinc carboxypeptidase family protein n=1 Tax=Brugia malayi TaxID=6279 RepID=A0A4E9EZK5_BRUMA|nr:Zinc carboxypeptidase family protein [Brugia malayi]VIO89779.1 Zinc carboxypeptidase family protein [Brugia malayi]
MENYTTIMQRIGYFNETMQIKVHTNEEILNELTSLHEKYPHITYLYEIGKSLQGRPLIVLAIGKNPMKHLPGIPEFKYVANIHGNEISGRELLLCLANILVINYGKNEVLTRLVNRTRIHLLPTMNPDGFSVAIPGKYGWLQGRTNAANVDLNRDFPQRLNPAMIRNVQPETSAVMRWTRSIPFVLSANLHDGSLVVNFPYDDGKIEGIEAKTGDHKLFVVLSYLYARAHHYMWKKGPRCINQHDDDSLDEGITNGNKWYRVSGGMQDWNYVFANCFELTIEMNCVKYSSDEQLKQIWNEHKFALISFIEKIHNTISGFVLDEINGIGIPGVQISIDNIGKTVLSSTDGDFWRLVIPGTYNVTFEHFRYEPVIRFVTVSKKKPYEFLNVTMSRRKFIGNFTEVYIVNSQIANASGTFVIFMILIIFHFFPILIS